MTVEDENGLYEHFSFKADTGQSPLRVDKFLMDRVENATRNKIQQLLLFKSTVQLSRQATKLSLKT